MCDSEPTPNTGPGRTMMNALEMIAATKTRRIKAGLVSTNGIACPTQAFVDYHNARNAAPRVADGRVFKTPALIALKAAAVASTRA